MSQAATKEIIERVGTLRRELTYHAQRYYVYDAPEISDYEYDRMYDELKRLEEQYPDLSNGFPPTRWVGELGSYRSGYCSSNRFNSSYMRSYS